MHHPVFIALWCCLTLVVSVAAQPKVAIVSDSQAPFIANAVDLLSVSLAGESEKYVLVERAEMIRLAEESAIQKLSAEQRPLALAKLAKADALIILGLDESHAKQPKLTVRLTSTKNGTVLKSLVLDGSKKEIAQTTLRAAKVLRFPCERLTQENDQPATVISLMGFRSALETNRTLDTSINLAISQQLSNQPNIVVSERWRMNDLIFERSIADEKLPGLSTGAALVDGSITRDKDSLTVSLRIRNAQADKGTTIQVRGNTKNPNLLAKDIVTKVVHTLSKGQQTEVWDSTKEGEEYAKLGEWLLSRRMFAESAQAFEAAVALGYQKGFTLLGRQQPYFGMIDPRMTYTVPSYELYGLDRLPDAEFRHMVKMMIRSSQCIIEMVDGNYGGLSKKELNIRNRLFPLGAQLRYNTRILQAICIRQQQLELASEARVLRDYSRHILAKGQAFKKHFGKEFVNRLYIPETPQQAAKELMQLLNPDSLTLRYDCPATWLRTEFWKTYHVPTLWRFVDWTSTDNRRGEDAWKKFIAELRKSKRLVNKLDGLAFAFQTTQNEQEQKQILMEYCALLEKNFKYISSPGGQKVFAVFQDFPFRKGDDRLFKAYYSRITQLYIRVFESRQWLTSHFISNVNTLTLYLCLHANGEETELSEANMAHLFQSMAHYHVWAKKDKRWKQNYASNAKSLQEIKERIIQYYPNINKTYIAPRPVIAGALPIKFWRPNDTSKNRLYGAEMIASGDSLFISRVREGIIELDVSSMTVKRFIKPPLKENLFISSLAVNQQTIMVCMDGRIFHCPRASSGEQWKEIKAPRSDSKKLFYWNIQSLKDGFFIGSRLTPHGLKSPVMLAGFADSAGNMDWITTSTRRPVLHPIDRFDPRSVHFAYQNKAGNTVMLLYRSGGRSPLVELESGKELASLHGAGFAQIRGDKTLYWCHGYYANKPRLDYMYLFDASQNKPQVIFRSYAANLSPALKKVRPLYHFGKPEFKGELLGAVVAKGYLWLLKREPENLQKYPKRDPNEFRLLRLNLDGSGSRTIPLSYQLNEEMVSMSSSLTPDSQKSMQVPILNSKSLTPTPKGLFFTSFGHEHTHSYGDYSVPGTQSPMLLYLTWDEIDAWLNKNGQ